MTIYTNISKPTGTSYTNTNSVGKEQYDQATLQYDDIGVYYDGLNPAQYTNVAKPNSTLITWADLTVAWSAETVVWGTNPNTYTKIAKPS